MYNEPITFDPAAKEIAHELKQFVARVRSMFSPRSSSATLSSARR